MKKTTIVAIVLAIAIITPVVIIAASTRNERIEQRKAELLMSNPEEIRSAYQRQNSVFRGLLYWSRTEDRKIQSVFLPINIRNPNIDGLSTSIYMDLTLYRQVTGRSLTYNHVIDYLSQEFEDDGEIRIWINGRHPEISAYVEWQRSDRNHSETYLYSDRLTEIYNDYVRRNHIPRTFNIFSLPLEMIYELISAESDPDYELDLTSIQNRYIVDGRAVVSEDGRSIEFIVPDAE